MQDAYSFTDPTSCIEQHHVLVWIQLNSTGGIPAINSLYSRKNNLSFNNFKVLIKTVENDHLKTVRIRNIVCIYIYIYEIYLIVCA